MIDPEVRAMLALKLVSGLGPRRTSDLLAHFGSASAILQASREQLQAVPGLGPKLAQTLVRNADSIDVDSEWQRIQRTNVNLLIHGSPEYPPSLSTIPDPPSLLYVRGELTESDQLAVAIVGSRRCSAYGKRVTRNLATELARAGCTVISGLARGIDGIAHRSAIDAGGRTIAVLANGLSRIYPPEHKSLADEVVGVGAVLTENCMKEPPLKELFPGRNRIISGLSRAVVIVEAAARSGTLITAGHAAEQGRSVLAIPGPIDSEGSAGTNALIRQGVVLCRGVDDVLEEIHGVSVMSQIEKQRENAPTLPSRKPPPDLDGDQKRIWDSLTDESRSQDELAQTLGIAVPQLSMALMTMEMKKLIQRLPGNRYARV